MDNIRDRKIRSFKVALEEYESLSPNVKVAFKEPVYISEENGEFVGAWQYFCCYGRFSKDEYKAALNSIHCDLNIKPAMPIETITMEFTIE